MSRALLITGATGRQGGAVINALVAKQPSDFLLLAVTRNAQSASAKYLAAKSPNIKLVEGDLESIPSLFQSAKKVAGTVPLWGVYSIQTSGGKAAVLEGEVRQGKGLIDESIKAGVQHFVYSSHRVEHHLRDSTSNGKSTMGWTILRPTTFMDNLGPSSAIKVFLTLLRDTMKDKPAQWIATEDIGYFASEAFFDPTTWNKKAIGLAGDELTFLQLSQSFETATGSPAPTTFGLLGKALKHGVPEMGVMVSWWYDDGYGANVAEIRRIHPNATTMEAYLKKSAYVSQTK
ncbi:hypothetical protein EDB81DRAFT_897218 [Dactylonectria macrodidyma]|uniref:NmrA-like domain-containing protein n=1 Tax=Dactylonectria macrodidyma TaxID=307937 RepID=A0A9P9FS79_9HYPO|nr:hypothetical protein EDB81DRAFT_897218 [Dactylonectria macrodidyma]